MGRQKKEWKPFSPQINQYRTEKWRKWIPRSRSQQNKVNYTTEPNKAHKNILKKEILQVINENFIDMLLDVVNQNVQEALKKFQDNKNKEYKKT
jgi:hypothetical protein